MLQQPRPPGRAHGVKHGLHRRPVWRHRQNRAVGKLPRCRPGAPLFEQLAEPAHRLLGRGEHRHPGIGERLAMMLRRRLTQHGGHHWDL